MNHWEKDNFPPGPWQAEPDTTFWVDQNDMACAIVRVKSGILCGYVGLADSHPLFGVNDDEVLLDLRVHGGISYAKQGLKSIQVPSGYENAWYIGFDCGQIGDLEPIFAREGCDTTNYRTFDYVKGEVERLAAQLTQEMDRD